MIRNLPDPDCWPKNYKRHCKKNKINKTFSVNQIQIEILFHQFVAD